MKRRTFLQLSGGGAAALALGGTLPELGCSAGAQKWFNEALSILNLVIPAASTILSLVGMPLPAVLLAAVQALIDLIQKYEAAPIDQQLPIVQQIDQAAKFLQANITEILNALQVKNGFLVNKVKALVGFVLSEIDVLIGLLPNLKLRTTKGLSKQVAKAPAGNAKEFKALFNKTLLTTTGDETTDALCASKVLK
jgi:hypothetical protein